MTVVDSERGSSIAKEGARRPRLVVASTFPIHPPAGGGQVRSAHLYGGLAERFDVEMVTLAARNVAGGRRAIAAGVWEHRVPKSAAHAATELELERAAGMVVTDIAMADLYALTPAYLSALRDAAAGAVAVIACHPYVYPAIREVTELPVWYDAHNVEALLKQDVLGPSAEAQRLLARVGAVERACYRGPSLSGRAAPTTGPS